jgi:hypothetical protein
MGKFNENTSFGTYICGRTDGRTDGKSMGDGKDAGNRNFSQVRKRPLEKKLLLNKIKYEYTIKRNKCYF